jgi:hypothetical protein
VGSSPWAQQTFGELAEDLARVVPACLRRAHERARDGHKGVHTQTLEVYGHGLHAVQFEELAAGLESLPGARSARLHGRTVMIVSNQIVYPIRYAKRNLPVTTARLKSAFGLRADLIRRHGPEPMQMELDLGLEEVEEQPIHPDLGNLPPGTGLVLVAYACSRHEGVMRVEWGSAELRVADRYLIWHHHEPL